MGLILHFHYGRQFLRYFILVLLGLSLLVVLFDLYELFRRSSGRSEIELYDTLRLGFYRLWRSIDFVFPFALLLSSLIFFYRQVYRNELLALKSFGVSFFSLLLSPLVCVFFLGLFNMFVVQYVASAFSQSYVSLEHLLFSPPAVANELFLSGADLWLREESPGRRVFIHFLGIEDDGRVLRDLEVFLLTERHEFLEKISASSARLYDGFWVLSDAIVWDGLEESHNRAYILYTDLTFDNIASGIWEAEHLSLWSLPGFISDMRLSGFSTLPYRLRFQQILSEPFFLLSLALLCGGFLLRLFRRDEVRRVWLLIFLSLSLVLLLYVMNELVYVWGLVGYLPVLLSVWFPVTISLCVGLGFVLYLEES